MSCVPVLVLVHRHLAQGWTLSFLPIRRARSCIPPSLRGGRSASTYLNNGYPGLHSALTHDPSHHPLSAPPGLHSQLLPPPGVLCPLASAPTTPSNAAHVLTACLRGHMLRATYAFQQAGQATDQWLSQPQHLPCRVCDP